MEKDFGIRFTDEMYATKDDVKKALNISSIDSIWDRIMQFRAYYTRQVGLRNIEKVPFSIVLPPKLTSKIVNLEKKMSKLLIKYSLSEVKNAKEILSFKNQQYINILATLAEIYEIEINSETLNALVNNSIPTLPVEYLVLSHYYKCLKYVETKTSGSINEMVITSLYCRLRGIEFDVNNLEGYYRSSELLDRSDHVFVGQHYEASPKDKIPELIKNLCDFLNDSNLFTLAKASICFFYINYLKPFEYYNEEMSLLLFKYVMAREDFDVLPSQVLFENLLIKEKMNKLKLLFYESEMKLDMTYITDYIVNYLIEAFQQYEDDLYSLDDHLLYSENFDIEDNQNTIPQKNIKVNENINLHPIEKVDHEIEGVNFKQNVSLPTMPIGLDEKDASMVANHLLEIYPSMKKGQAEFYSRHCTIGKYYTISQYKKEQDVAYETARTSMDNLVNLGFYKKEQIKNKFVYTPVVKNNG